MNRGLAIALIVGALFAGAGLGIFAFIYITGGNDDATEDVNDVREGLSLDDPTPTRDIDSVIAQNESLQTQLDNLQSTITAQENIISTLEAAPTEAPTEMPTEMPTEIPTEAPTEMPTEMPTEAATEAPIGANAATDEQPSSTEEPAEQATQAATEAPTDATTDTSTSSAVVPEDAVRGLYQFIPEETEARYRINEVLNGDPFEVVGVTQDDELGDVGGDFIINYQDPALSSIGEIVINARRFATDNGNRDNAVRSRILQTNEHQFIRFNPTRIIALDGAPVEVGTVIRFQVEGDLTVRNVTRTETFEVEVTAESFERIVGYATTTIQYPDYNITIRAPGFVSDIEDTVVLEIDFVAELQETRND